MKHNNCNDFAIKYGGSEAIADLEILKFRKSPTILRIVLPTMSEGKGSNSGYISERYVSLKPLRNCLSRDEANKLSCNTNTECKGFEESEKRSGLNDEREERKSESESDSNSSDEESFSNNKRKRRHRNLNRSNYPSEITKVLMEWFSKNLDNPYPNEADRIRMCKTTGLTRKQLRVWLINARKRKLEKAKTESTSKRDIKIQSREEREVQENYEMPQDKIQILSLFRPRKTTMIDLFQNYQNVLNEEYILKLFYFTTLVQQYCFCDYIEEPNFQSN